MQPQTNVPIFSAVRSMLTHIKNISSMRAGAIRCLLSGMICVDHYESSRVGELAALESARKYLESAREWEISKGYFGATSQARYLEAHGLLCDLVAGLELEMQLEAPGSMIQTGFPVSLSVGVVA